MMRDKQSVIGERIKQLRLGNGLTLKALAEATGLSMSAISNYEYGFRQPNAKAMVAFEAFFNVSGAYLAGDTDERGTMYFWDDTELMGELKSGLPNLFKAVLEATAACPDKDQKMVFNIMVELRHILSSNSIDKKQKSVAVELLQETVSQSTRFMDSYVHGNIGELFENNRVAKVRQSCVENFENALLLAEKNMNVKA